MKYQSIMRFFTLMGLLCFQGGFLAAQQPVFLSSGYNSTENLWADAPADKWENAYPVGNGRLGAMVRGGTGREVIQFNEETHWSGGPYSTVVEGGHEFLPEIQKLIFDGQYRKAHKLFARKLMGYPVEQQKYQSTGDLVLNFHSQGDVSQYSRRLDLDEAICTVTYVQNGVWFTQEVFATPVDQVIAVRLTADRPGAVSLTANLNGYRNTAHSNYGTDYYFKDPWGDDGLMLTGKSDDYLGIEGRLRYEALVKALPEGGRMKVEDEDLIITGADAVTFYIAAATNFVNYRDISADAHARNTAVFEALEGRSYVEIKAAHIKEHQKAFRRVSLDLGDRPESRLPTAERLAVFDGSNDPNLAALCFQFGRYLLISSSRPGTEPANLQGIWNSYMNPNWDSKYTTNINTEMNYWPAEVANLSEFAQPLFKMIEELTDEGRRVAEEHYGKAGWVFHQNTDLWRVAAPMDGAQWGTFTTGGVWLCTHLWEHYLYTGDLDFLTRVYPVMKGSAEFFLDFLTEHPGHGWLVTNPSTSPENFPGRPGNYERFEDELTDYWTPGITICAGASIDMQLLNDFFGYVAESARLLKTDDVFRETVLKAKEKLAPMQIGMKGDLQEWLEDWAQKEKSHRHISNLYGLYPGNQISAERTPALAEACKVVLDQRGLEGNGWSSVWKMACWARLYNADRAMANFDYYVHHYCLNSLFALCSGALQVDGSFGLTAAVAEMLMQSHGSAIHLLPCLPASWGDGQVRGLRARGGFEVDITWRKGQLKDAVIRSEKGGVCHVVWHNEKRKITLKPGGTWHWNP